ncbi:VOC family protein [Actinoallomurus rhizosphaericola]|uniref:VOC family protein n=1 Tax=Actinoallomurus rhizosphaericola TaxID=2952536 RepID=UPI0020924308|nr:VOC family protein [Actinoallomurus rhizosphaericola]MCO5998064.1 VOC family protein [Actinoallomurus rhizosphaericola]
MPNPNLITCLWFNGNGEEAAEFYTSVFKDSSIGRINRFTATGPGPEGSVASVEFTLNGMDFIALNGGPAFTFTGAISFQVPCADQAELDYYYDALAAGGEEGPGGWLKDKYGVSWQVFPAVLPDMLNAPDREKAARAAKVMMGTRGKMDVAALQRAFDGD